MTDDLIDSLSSDLAPVGRHALSRRIVGAAGLGLVATIVIGFALLAFVVNRPFGGAEGMMFWGKLAYAVTLGGLGLAALPALSRPERSAALPLVAAGILVLVALILGLVNWVEAAWAMPVLMGGTALACPWLIIATSVPLLAVLLGGMRRFAPRSPALAGFAAGLVAGGFGAAAYALWCGETSMTFIAVWYSLGIALVALIGAALGARLLRW